MIIFININLSKKSYNTKYIMFLFKPKKEVAAKEEPKFNQDLAIEGSKAIIDNNYNKELKSQLLNITKDVIKASGTDKLSDDLTVLAIGK